MQAAGNCAGSVYFRCPWVSVGASLLPCDSFPCWHTQGQILREPSLPWPQKVPAGMTTSQVEIYGGISEGPSLLSVSDHLFGCSEQLTASEQLTKPPGLGFVAQALFAPLWKWDGDDQLPYMSRSNAEAQVTPVLYAYPFLELHLCCKGSTRHV